MYSGVTAGSCQLNRSGGFKQRWTPAGARRSRPRRCVVQPVANRHLQIVFVTTEVAPWSKVGGLGDVMAALPAALAARGHRVMTVSPMYSAYADVRDTGVRVPVRLPDDLLEQQQSEPQPEAQCQQHQPVQCPQGTAPQQVQEKQVVQQHQQHMQQYWQQDVEAPQQPQLPLQVQQLRQRGVHPQKQRSSDVSYAAALRKAARVYARGGALDPGTAARAASVYQREADPNSSEQQGNMDGTCNGGYARYYMCCSAGVHRVFVDHPLYRAGGHRGAGRPWPAAIISSYTHPAAAASGKAMPDLAAAASVLCQAALAAPLLLWGVSRGLDAQEQLQLPQQRLSKPVQRRQEAELNRQQLEMQLLMDLLDWDNAIALAEASMAGMDSSSAGGVATVLSAAAGEQQAKLALHLQHPQQIVAGLATPVLLGTAGSAADSRWQVSDLLLPRQCEQGSTSSPAAPAADSPVLFVANDWPCGVLPLWLETYKEEAQHWQQQNPHMAWLKQQQQQDLFDKVRQEQQLNAGAGVHDLVQAAVGACSSVDSTNSSIDGTGMYSSSMQPLDDVFGDYAAVYVNDLSSPTAQKQQLLHELHPDWQQHQNSEPLQQRGDAAGAPDTTFGGSYDSSSSWSAAADAWLQEVGYDPGSVYDADLCELVAAAAQAGRVPAERLPEITELQSQLQAALEQEQVLGEAISKLRMVTATALSPQQATGSPDTGRQRSMAAAPAMAAAASHQQELLLLHQMLGRQLADSKVVFAVHNYAYQGTFQGRSSFDRLGLPRHMLSRFMAPVVQAANIVSRTAQRAAAAAAAAVGSQLAALAEALLRLVPSTASSNSGYISRDAGLLSSVQSALLQSQAEELLHQSETVGGRGHQQLDPVGRLHNGRVPGQHVGSIGQQHQVLNTGPADEAMTQLNWLHAGVSASDMTITVSDGYAQQMLAGSWEATGTLSDSSPSMTALLASKKLRGILNGLDTQCWDPARDPLLPSSVRYTAKTAAAGKEAAKQLLQQRLGLKVDPAAPLFAFVGRLAPQKGVDVILAAVPQLMRVDAAEALSAAAEGTAHQQLQQAQQHVAPGPSAAAGGVGPQLVMLGAGERWMEEVLDQLAAKYPGQAVGVPAFNEPLAHLIMAAADALLVPSRFEPCGLVALAGLRYGAVPVATATGGLADIVNGEVGYLVPNPGPEGDTAGFRKGVSALAAAMQEVAQAYGSQAFDAKRIAAMSVDVSWDAPCQAWEQVLLELVNQNATAGGKAVAGSNAVVGDGPEDAAAGTMSSS